MLTYLGFKPLNELFLLPYFFRHLTVYISNLTERFLAGCTVLFDLIHIGSLVLELILDFSLLTLQLVDVLVQLVQLDFLSLDLLVIIVQFLQASLLFFLCIRQFLFCLKHVIFEISQPVFSLPACYFPLLLDLLCSVQIILLIRDLSLQLLVADRHVVCLSL